MDARESAPIPVALTISGQGKTKPLHGFIAFSGSAAPCCLFWDDMRWARENATHHAVLTIPHPPFACCSSRV